jgi:hypothetical protein
LRVVTGHVRIDQGIIVSWDALGIIDSEDQVGICVYGQMDGLLSRCHGHFSHVAVASRLLMMCRPGRYWRVPNIRVFG